MSDPVQSDTTATQNLEASPSREKNTLGGNAIAATIRTVGGTGVGLIAGAIANIPRDFPAGYWPGVCATVAAPTAIVAAATEWTAPHVREGIARDAFRVLPASLTAAALAVTQWEPALENSVAPGKLLQTLGFAGVLGAAFVIHHGANKLKRLYDGRDGADETMLRNLEDGRAARTMQR